MPEPVGVLAGVRRVRQSNTWIFATMLVSACLSLTASFVLSVDAIILAADPHAALSCNINTVISCGTVGTSWQASLFGFPNAFLGLVAEPVVITIAVASLGGVRFPRWFMLSAQVVYTIGVVFAYWLFFQAYFVIGALCPWCLLVTLSTTLVFTSLTHVNIRDGNLYLPPRASAAARRFVAADLDVLVVAVWLMAVVMMVVTKYVPLMA
ncbi:MAG: vitamin K epoxide reductase family protein [Propionicimonas sp.]|uniref:vitamin K epoxide reductase family protein n=1 Tax=Propionicimonas sp. TaxID=1955623 RepID=UPI003D14E97F